MASAADPTRSSFAGASAPILIVCLFLSLLVHALTAGGFGEYVRTHPVNQNQSAPEITIPDMPTPEDQEDPPIRLGRQESKTASITWLGVLENPVEGDAPESEVEQAELAINTGDRDASQSQMTRPQQPAESVPETAQQPAEKPAPTETVLPEPPTEADTQREAQAELERAQQPPTEQASPEQATPMEQKESDPEPVVEANEAETVKPESQPDPVEEPEQAEQQTVQAEAQPEPEPAEQAPSEPETSQEQRPEETAPPTPPQTQEQQNSPSEQGKAGEEDDRESIATMIKRAESHSANDLNRPLSSSGLEIKPVEPRYPAAVRFTQLPRNPVVIIRFNAKGRVIFTDFVRDKEKRRVYDTGSRAVDEPLLSAIYKWRAEGEPLKELDPDDPKSYIEIPMKIIFREDS